MPQRTLEVKGLKEGQTRRCPIAAIGDDQNVRHGSRKYTRSIGCRSLDILHVATAVELEFKYFATFDVRQQQLAKAAGLKIILPSA